MNVKKAILTLIIAGLTAGSGCSDDPGKLGAGLISPSDTVSVRHYTTFGTSESAFLYRVNGINNTLVGSYGNVESRPLLEFPALSSVPDTAIIDTAVLEIPVHDHHPFSLTFINTGSNRLVLAEIPGKPDAFNSLIFFRQPLY